MQLGFKPVIFFCFHVLILGVFFFKGKTIHYPKGNSSSCLHSLGLLEIEWNKAKSVFESVCFFLIWYFFKYTFEVVTSELSAINQYAESAIHSKWNMSTK